MKHKIGKINIASKMFMTGTWLFCRFLRKGSKSIFAISRYCDFCVYGFFSAYFLRKIKSKHVELSIISQILICQKNVSFEPSISLDITIFMPNNRAYFSYWMDLLPFLRKLGLTSFSEKNLCSIFFWEGSKSKLFTKFLRFGSMYFGLYCKI